MKNKQFKKLTALVSVIILGTGLIGCNRQVTLQDSVEQLAKSDSFSYDIALSVKGEQSPNIAYNLSGDVLKEKDKLTVSSNIKANMGMINLELPVYLVKEKSTDGEVLFKIPDSINSVYGLEANKYVKISSEEIKTYMNENVTKEESLEFEKEYNKLIEQNKNSQQMSKDFMAVFFKYLNDNKDTTTFEKIENKKQSSDGIYKTKLNADNLKEISLAYVNNDEYFETYKSIMSLQQSYSGEEASISKEDVISEINESFDSMQDSDSNIELTFTVNNKCLTQIDIDINNTELNNATINIKFSNINEIKNIDVPNDKDTLGINELLEKFMLGIE